MGGQYKSGLYKMGSEDVSWIQLALDRVLRGTLVHVVRNFRGS